MQPMKKEIGREKSESQEPPQKHYGWDYHQIKAESRDSVTEIQV